MQSACRYDDERRKEKKRENLWNSVYQLAYNNSKKEVGHAKDPDPHRYFRSPRRLILALARKNPPGAAPGGYYHTQARPEGFHPNHQHGGHQHHCFHHSLDFQKMIIATHQPYFAPFPGFFYKAHLADILVILDDVQFPRRTTWISRNRFKNAQGTLWMTIPVWKKGLGLQTIKEVRICYEGGWERKHLESLRTAYGRSPYFPDHSEFIKELFSGKFENLVDLNLEIILYLVELLPIKTEITLLSELGIRDKGTRLLVETCKALGGSQILVQNPAAKYFAALPFQEAGIHLRTFKYPSPVYPQLWGDFIPNLSMWDMVFNCGPKSWDIVTGKK